MTIDKPTALPPRWAESLLRLFLRPDDRESVPGDLLEEYREAIVPVLGARADRWYVEQVSRYVLRVVWPPALVIGATFVIRFLLDAFVQTTYVRGVFHPRSTIMSNVLIATWLVSAAWQTWRTDRIRTGVFVAFLAQALGGLIGSLGAAGTVAIWHDPDTLWAIKSSGGMDEALWGVPLMLLPVSVACGAVAAVAAKCLRWPFRHVAS